MTKGRNNQKTENNRCQNCGEALVWEVRSEVGNDKMFLQAVCENCGILYKKDLEVVDLRDKLRQTHRELVKQEKEYRGCKRKWEAEFDLLADVQEWGSEGDREEIKKYIRGNFVSKFEIKKYTEEYFRDLIAIPNPQKTKKELIDKLIR